MKNILDEMIVATATVAFLVILVGGFVFMVNMIAGGAI